MSWFTIPSLRHSKIIVGDPPLPKRRHVVNADALNKLANDVDEYLHWRSVNKHITGGENYLRRLKDSLNNLMGPLV